MMNIKTVMDVEKLASDPKLLKALDDLVNKKVTSTDED